MARISKVATWFSSDFGKRVSFVMVGAASVATISAHFLPQTLFLSHYTNFVQMYKDGMSVPVPEKIKKRFQRALELAEVDPEDRYLFRPFSAYGFEIFSLGSTFSKFGVRIGIPSNYSYENASDVEKDKIKINLESVVWESEPAKDLLNSLLLSEKAQLYAMVREMKYSQTPKLLLDTFFGTSSVLCAYLLSSTLNTRLKLFSKPTGTRVLMYIMVGTLMLGNYIMCVDVSQLYYEQKIDDEIKRKNPMLAEGGREYYEKIMLRNKALRKLLGKEGEHRYSVHGNENQMFRTKHLPLDHRKAIFEETPTQSSAA